MRGGPVLVTDGRTHLVLAAVPGRGPASDLVLFKAALSQATGRARIGTLLADADFDGEWVHEHVRSDGIRTLIPPQRGRPSEKPPVGKWRRRMKQRFDKKKYGQRWQTETVNSMIKRRLGSALRARSYWSQCREIILRVITHNVMIFIRVRVFYRALLGQYRKLLKYRHADLELTEGAIREIARMAHECGTGARGLRTVVERVLEPVLFDPRPWMTARITEATVRGGEVEYDPFGLPGAAPLRTRLARRARG